jgi:signal transduction histidine kinase
VIFRDTGIGIPPEVQKDLFSPFHTTKPDGLGLGLFISQSIIEDHGGKIEMQSCPGEGTTFTIWLPGHSSEGASKDAP